jgi:hypothetical protein
MNGTAMTDFPYCFMFIHNLPLCAIFKQQQQKPRFSAVFGFDVRFFSAKLCPAP